MEYSQVVRHRFLVPACKGSNPFTPDYEHPIGSVKNELTTTGEAADCSPWAQLVASHVPWTYFAKRRERRERQTAESNPSNQPTRIVRSILSSILWRTYNYALLSHNPNPLGPSWQTQIVWFTETNLLSRQVEDAEFSFTDKLGHDLSINKNEELLWINLDWYGNRISSSIQNINSLINIYAIYKYTKSC